MSNKIRLKQDKKKNKGFVCPFCTDGSVIPIKRGNIIEHLIVTLDNNNHFHIHGPIDDKELIKQFILKIAKEAKIEIEDEED